MIFKKSHSVTEFTFIWLNNFKIVELTRSNFYIYNINVIAPWTLDFGGRLPPPPLPLSYFPA
jgi:hypothetical protein